MYYIKFIISDNTIIVLIVDLVSSLYVTDPYRPFALG